MMSFKSKIHGFTLLEILVVLVILGLISGLLLQGLGYTLMQKERMVKQLGKVQVAVLQEWWFRKSSESIILPQIDNLVEPFDFKADTQRFSATSLFALDAPIGVATRVDWWLENNEQSTTLYYQSAKSEPWRIASWLTDDVSFTYRDRFNQWHQQWPNQQFPDELPIGILLTVKEGEEETVWYSRIFAEKKAIINPVFNQ